jgi:type I restriction enzyme S subunit
MSSIIDYRGKTPKKASFGVPLVTAKIVKQGRILDFQEYIPLENYDSWMRRGLPQSGDVVMTTEAPLGEIAQLDNRKVALAQRLVTLRGKPELLDNTFLKFLMMSVIVQGQLRGRATGTTVQGIKQSELRKIRLILPPLDEQLAIARILGALDDKIELNRRMNYTLESMAQAIFKSWFVDFDPVIAKSDELQPYGLNLKTAKLFPEKFKYIDGEAIPDGWEYVLLPEFFDINPERSLPRGCIAPYLEMANMPTKIHSPENWIERKFGSGMRFINGDTLVARITPCLENGKTAYVDFLMDDQVGWGSTEYIVLRPKSPYPPLYAYCLARTEDFRGYAIQSMTGSSGRQRVPVESLTYLKIIKPSIEVASVFGDLVNPLFAKVKTNISESRILASIRDSLVPKLILGEIRVQQAESLVEKLT